MVSPARRAAYRALRSVHTGRADLAGILDGQRAALADERDRALAADITIGTLRWRATLDHVIGWAGHRPVEAFDVEVLDLLRLSAYQLLHLDRVPASAVVHDAVDLCRLEGKTSASGAVNAILRRISRSRQNLPLPSERDELDYLSITQSHPRWLVARWLARLGYDTAVRWVRFNNQPAPMMVRANRLRTTRDRLAAALADEGIAAVPARYAPDGLCITHGNPLKSGLADSGLFFVQDESSQLVAVFAGVQPGDVVLDACAAPGGKTAQMAADLDGHGALVACDLRPRRMRLLARTLQAAGARAVGLARVDLLGGLPFGAVFDRVLVDAPCSGLGTLRRDPDVKWRRLEADLAAFARRQHQMLASAAAAVKPGGRLVYSTCSSEPDENEQVVDGFLAAHAWFVREDPSTVSRGLPPGVAACLDQDGALRPSPHEHGLEPFYAARLRRTG